ncbi:putative Ubiquitin C-terminal hydrolase 13 [Blattamonas nauphoetae]|uniref:Ubiquitin C-terminal hydrolase 13 n=1 Tax=Blattamonas nauphoetae TaxID=2049346 RepID=A0ABQ9Y734_9EUKA|nr:putative Ubiquitin C-terminal hydrolase 13 [Blattamonas nauphoetae]
MDLELNLEDTYPRSAVLGPLPAEINNTSHPKPPQLQSVALTFLVPYTPNVRSTSDVIDALGVQWHVIVGIPRTIGFLPAYIEMSSNKRIFKKYVTISMVLVNNDPSLSIQKTFDNTFDNYHPNIGSHELLPLTALDEDGGFLEDGYLRFQVGITEAIKLTQREAFGMVGLKNQGATCYLNSLIQSLFHTNLFRWLVYHMPLSEENEDSDDESSSDSSTGRVTNNYFWQQQKEKVKKIALASALQRLFFNLQTSQSSCSTKELTRSFGWTAEDSFEQHDASELNRVMLDKLMEKMKGTAYTGGIEMLLEGRMYSSIACLHVDYESAREEPFFDLNLPVRGCATLEDSFRKYTEEEVLEGDNQYSAGQFGHQDAKKSSKLLSLPAVLHLQLNRWEYDVYRDEMVKVNDRFEFPSELDVAPFVVDLTEQQRRKLLEQRQEDKIERERREMEKKEKAAQFPAEETVEMAEDMKQTFASIISSQERHSLERGIPYSEMETKYWLHSVLVHSGFVGGGHYYVFLRRHPSEEWVCINDSGVRASNALEAMEENYGGSDLDGTTRTRVASAYMLVYVRQDVKEEVLREVGMNEIPSHISESLLARKDKKNRVLFKIHSKRGFEKKVGQVWKMSQEERRKKEVRKETHKIRTLCMEKKQGLDASQATSMSLPRTSTVTELLAELSRRTGISEDEMNVWRVERVVTKAKVGYWDEDETEMRPTIKIDPALRKRKDEQTTDLFTRTINHIFIDQKTREEQEEEKRWEEEWIRTRPEREKQWKEEMEELVQRREAEILRLRQKRERRHQQLLEQQLARQEQAKEQKTKDDQTHPPIQSDPDVSSSDDDTGSSTSTTVDDSVDIDLNSSDIADALEDSSEFEARIQDEIKKDDEANQELFEKRVRADQLKTCPVSTMMLFLHLYSVVDAESSVGDVFGATCMLMGALNVDREEGLGEKEEEVREMALQHFVKERRAEREQKRRETRRNGETEQERAEREKEEDLEDAKAASDYETTLTTLHPFFFLIHNHTISTPLSSSIPLADYRLTNGTSIAVQFVTWEALALLETEAEMEDRRTQNYNRLLSPEDLSAHQARLPELETCGALWIEQRRKRMIILTLFNMQPTTPAQLHLEVDREMGQREFMQMLSEELNWPVNQILLQRQTHYDASLLPELLALKLDDLAHPKQERTEQPPQLIPSWDEIDVDSAWNDTITSTTPLIDENPPLNDLVCRYARGQTNLQWRYAVPDFLEFRKLDCAVSEWASMEHFVVRVRDGRRPLQSRVVMEEQEFFGNKERRIDSLPPNVLTFQNEARNDEPTSASDPKPVLRIADTGRSFMAEYEVAFDRDACVGDVLIDLRKKMAANRPELLFESRVREHIRIQGEIEKKIEERRQRRVKRREEEEKKRGDKKKPMRDEPLYEDYSSDEDYAYRKEELWKERMIRVMMEKEENCGDKEECGKAKEGGENGEVEEKNENGKRNVDEREGQENKNDEQDSETTEQPNPNPAPAANEATVTQDLQNTDITLSITPTITDPIPTIVELDGWDYDLDEDNTPKPAQTDFEIRDWLRHTTDRLQNTTSDEKKKEIVEDMLENMVKLKEIVYQPPQLINRADEWDYSDDEMTSMRDRLLGKKRTPSSQEKDDKTDEQDDMPELELVDQKPTTELLFPSGQLDYASIDYETVPIRVCLLAQRYTSELSMVIEEFEKVSDLQKMNRVIMVEFLPPPLPWPSMAGAVREIPVYFSRSVGYYSQWISILGKKRTFFIPFYAHDKTIDLLRRVFSIAQNVMSASQFALSEVQMMDSTHNVVKQPHYDCVSYIYIAPYSLPVRVSKPYNYMKSYARKETAIVIKD